MSSNDVIKLLEANPNIMGYWLQSKKREVYSRSGKFIVKKTYSNGEIEKIEIYKQRGY